MIEFTLDYLRKRSPRLSGEFRSSWFVMVNGQRVTDLSAVPVEATVIVTNDRPYARKIEVGGMRMSVPHGVAEDGRTAVRRAYGAVVEVRNAMIQLPGGYVLKRRSRQGRRSPGQEVTYPALVMHMKA